MARKSYIERFDNGPGGWLGWISNAAGAKRLEIVQGALLASGPWWIDYNHAPPGGGYLQILCGLHTRHPAGFPSQYLDVGGENHFVREQFPTDFRNARITVRLKGELALRGAQPLLLIQSRVDSIHANHVLVGQPLHVDRDWSTQTLDLRPDPDQWLCLGSRHDRHESYGHSSIDEALRNVDGDIIFVLFPVNVVPIQPIGEQMHTLRAGEDYAVDAAKLPQGHVLFDEIRIDFAKNHRAGD